jgi:molybdopterin-containing oxidoreductase family iron-sulfur binding subunit
MEKMFMCIQMTQATILMLRKGREVIEGEFQTACSNACSTGAMTLVISMLKKVRLLN